mmetsp:Transcript_36584/g.91726  ORF Transcript_36584/g.91726 Transcript_36584/m.91726 type:complete len:379 (-) Transcript_36584:1671-2807(-)
MRSCSKISCVRFCSSASVASESRVTSFMAHWKPSTTTEKTCAQLPPLPITSNTSTLDVSIFKCFLTFFLRRITDELRSSFLSLSPVGRDVFESLIILKPTFTKSDCSSSSSEKIPTSSSFTLKMLFRFSISTISWGVPRPASSCFSHDWNSTERRKPNTSMPSCSARWASRGLKYRGLSTSRRRSLSPIISCVTLLGMNLHGVAMYFSKSALPVAIMSSHSPVENLLRSLYISSNTPSSRRVRKEKNRLRMLGSLAMLSSCASPTRLLRAGLRERCSGLADMLVGVLRRPGDMARPSRSGDVLREWVKKESARSSHTNRSRGRRMEHSDLLSCAVSSVLSTSKKLATVVLTNPTLRAVRVGVPWRSHVSTSEGGNEAT